MEGLVGEREGAAGVGSVGIGVGGKMGRWERRGLADAKKLLRHPKRRLRGLNCGGEELRG